LAKNIKSHFSCLCLLGVKLGRSLKSHVQVVQFFS
jgi:hypothetical protein